MWVGKGSELYNNFYKKWLQNNDIVMYSTHNEGKSVVAERYIRTYWDIKEQNLRTHDFNIKKPVY